jgi:transglutaminase-like putative cysteine protease
LRQKEITTLIVLLAIVMNIKGALSDYQGKCTLVLTYTFENRGNETYATTEKDATVSLINNNNWQIVKVLNITHDIEREHIDPDGNKFVILNLPSKIPPHESVSFSMMYEIESTYRSKTKINFKEAGKPSDIPQGIIEEFCVGTETFTTGDEEVQYFAHTLTANETTVLDMVVTLLDWFIVNVSYSPHDVPLYPNETLNSMKGDCDDQAILFVTFCRSLKIPAILQIGYVLNDDIEGKKSSWGGHLYIKQRGVERHAWALAYIPPWGWLPIDMTLVSSLEPIRMITDAPKYDGNIITCLNVSRQAYIGDIRDSRKQLMSSDLYIIMSQMVIEEIKVAPWMKMINSVKENIAHILVFLLSTFPILIFIIESIMFVYCLLLLL